METAATLSNFQFKLSVVPLQPQTPEHPSQLTLFRATSLEIHQVARWCRASPENTLSDLPIVNDPKDLVMKNDGMALCLYDDTMMVWSTARDLVSQWSEVGQRIVDAIEKHPTIQSSWDQNINHLDMGQERLQNFREDLLLVDGDGSVRPIPSPFVLTNSLDEEVKKLEAALFNLPSDEDEEEPRFPHSPLSDVSDVASTPPLSPDSVGSPYGLPGSPELESPFLLTLPLSLGGHLTISPSEIFSPLPEVEVPIDTAMEPETPPAPVVSVKPLPMLDITPPTSPSLPSPPPSPSPSSSAAGPSRRSVLKRSRWAKNESDDESDEFVPERQKAGRPSKRAKFGAFKRVSGKLEGRGTKCDFCGKRIGRVTDLPRHNVSCKQNPERAERATNCEICGKLLPVRPDAIKRHYASKTCLSKRQNGDNEDPHLSEP